ncbi:MAG: nucleotidyltransferase domain-containing protein [Phycisphaerae bacterium]|nr:nucleotidyltransferase domain-containing protein [Phycisphaerae bacterium]
MENGKCSMDIEVLLKESKTRLAAAFGTRLRGAMVYGSQPRGEAEADSDIDLMVLLEGPVAFGCDLETIIHALYPLQLEIDRQIDAWPADVKAYEAQEFAIYRNVRREGVAL